MKNSVSHFYTVYKNQVWVFTNLSKYQFSQSLQCWSIGCRVTTTLSCQRLRSVLSLPCQRSRTHQSLVASDLFNAHFSLGPEPTGSCILSLIACAGLENQYKSSFSIRHCRVCAAPAPFSRQVRGLAGAAPLLTLTSLT